MKTVLIAVVALVAVTALGTSCQKEFSSTPSSVEVTEVFDNGRTIELANNGHLTLNMPMPFDSVAYRDVLAYDKTQFKLLSVSQDQVVHGIRDNVYVLLGTKHWDLLALKPSKGTITLTEVGKAGEGPNKNIFTCTVIVR